MDGFVKSQKYDGKEKSSRSRRANLVCEAYIRYAAMTKMKLNADIELFTKPSNFPNEGSVINYGTDIPSINFGRHIQFFMSSRCSLLQ